MRLLLASCKPTVGLISSKIDPPKPLLVMNDLDNIALSAEVTSRVLPSGSLKVLTYKGVNLATLY